MSLSMFAPVLVSILPVLGGLVVLLLSSHHRAAKWMAASIGAATLAGFLATQGNLGVPSMLAIVLIVSAILSIISQQTSHIPDRTGAIVLLLLGQSLGALLAPRLLGQLLLVSTSVTISLVIWLLRDRLDSVRVGAIVSLGAGALAVVLSLTLPEMPGSLLFLIGSATLLPLFPLHGGYVGSIASLPGTLPAFVAVTLPCLGWYGLATGVQGLPSSAREGLVALAVLSAVIALVRAAAQIQLNRLVASITVSLFGGVWWCLGTIGTAAPAGWYMAAVVLAVNGLLLGIYVLEARYGVRDVEKLSGLAHPMPRFAFLMGLLFMAAMGLPLFGVFSAFMTMMFAVSPPRPSLFFIVAGWFVSSLLLSKVWHRLFYGPPRADVIYSDLNMAEVIPFVTLIVLLLLGAPLLTSLGTGTESAAVITARDQP